MGARTSIVIYVTRDIERALGMKPGEHYMIIANKTAYAEEIRAHYPQHVFLIEEKNLLDTHELLAHSDVGKIITGIHQKSQEYETGIIVFKNTSRIEEICREKKWRLLNPTAALAEKIENKITQVEWLGKMTSYLPEHRIMKTKDIQWGIFNANKSPFIIQWAHSHTGDGTALVRSEKELELIASKFPEREARVTEYIRGPMFTANICVHHNDPQKISIGNISYQITGILPFTDNPFSTIGNDWSLPHSVLCPEHIDRFNTIAREVGEHMGGAGWRGLFGIDCIYDEERDMVHLIEINARQPASVTFESQLQESLRPHLSGSTLFELHIAALAGAADQSAHSPNSIIEINDGAQVIQRLTVSANILLENPEKIMTATEALRTAGFTVIEYPNTKANSDILRIQSSRGIMEAPLKFNTRGKKIIDILLA